MIRWVHQAPEGVEHRIYRSEAMGCDVGCNVYTPPAEAGDPPYPVLYWLHGAAGTENSGLVLVQRVHRAITRGDLPPIMMVLPNGGQRTMYSDSADGSILAETTIMEELIPWIDRHCPTLPTRGGRAIQGFSMGGYGALKLGIKFGERFASVVSLGGALHDLESLSSRRRDIYETMFAADPEAFRPHSPHQLVRERLEFVRARQNIQIYVGSEDLTRPMNEGFHRLLEELGVRHHYEVLDRVRHNVREYYREAGDRILGFHTEHFTR